MFSNMMELVILSLIQEGQHAYNISKQIEEVFGHTTYPSNISAKIAGMESRGLVHRGEPKKGGRGKKRILQITPLGEERKETLKFDWRSCEAAMNHILSKGEKTDEHH